MKPQVSVATYKVHTFDIFTCIICLQDQNKTMYIVNLSGVVPILVAYF